MNRPYLMVCQKKDTFLVLLFSLAFALFSGCNPDPVNKLDTRFSAHNRLIFEVNFSLNATGDAFIEYWLQGDSIRQFSGLSTASMDHFVSIFNLLPDTAYNYCIHTRQEGKFGESPVYQFKTDTLPSRLPSYKLIKDDFDFNGYILLKVFSDPGALIILNQKAEIVWYHIYDTAVVRPFEFTYNGLILSLVDSSLIEEVALSGELLRRINTKEHGIDRIHHELFKNRKNQYIGLTYTQKVLDLSDLNGNPSDTVNADGMVVMDSLGNKIWEWDIFDHTDPMKDDSLLQRKKDWGHANSIAYDRDGHYLVSFRDFSQIWKIHSKTGEIIWKLGQNGNFQIKNTEWFLNQHDAHINPQGDLIMFDNGNHLRGYSRILALSYDEQGFICHPVIDIKLGPSQTTFRMGSVQMIDSAHILVCSPKKILSLVVYDINGDIVWEASGTKDSYKAYYLPRERIEHKRWF